MFKSLHYSFHQLHLLFTNLITTLIIPIIVTLSLASGYTTFHGMTLFINDWIAGVMTFAVQAIIILVAFELSKTHVRANRLRFTSLLVSLLIGLSISIFFSYFTFFEKSQAISIRENKFRQLKTEIENYKQLLIKKKIEVLNEKNREIQQARSQADSAEIGRGSFLPDSLKGIVGRGRFYRVKKQEENRFLSELEDFKADFAMIESTADSFIAGLSIEGLQDSTNFRSMEIDFAQLATAANRILSDYGYTVESPPPLFSYSSYIATVPPFANLARLALALAVIIDLLTFIFSYRLHNMPQRDLSDSERRLVYLAFKEFSEYSVNKRDQLQIKIDKNKVEKAIDYNDSFRTLIAAMLLKYDFLRRVDNGNAEFTANLYPVIVEEYIKDISNSRKDKKITGSKKVQRKPGGR